MVTTPTAGHRHRTLDIDIDIGHTQIFQLVLESVQAAAIAVRWTDNK